MDTLQENIKSTLMKNMVDCSHYAIGYSPEQETETPEYETYSTTRPTTYTYYPVQTTTTTTQRATAATRVHRPYKTYSTGHTRQIYHQTYAATYTTPARVTTATTSAAARKTTVNAKIDKDCQLSFLLIVDSAENETVAEPYHIYALQILRKISELSDEVLITFVDLADPAKAYINFPVPVYRFKREANKLRNVSVNLHHLFFTVDDYTEIIPNNRLKSIAVVIVLTKALFSIEAAALNGENLRSHGAVVYAISLEEVTIENTDKLSSLTGSPLRVFTQEVISDLYDSLKDLSVTCYTADLDT
ncbi:unnamed protein product [Soboliphyme baturini]|uniref:VWFA domain-containing protein n=1 Tax=Soboliphyme baturini TaxID=241478 RepID=A0A183J566_9BILA|nr:unnamed protein product [Soboliphyme baturini]